MLKPASTTFTLCCQQLSHERKKRRKKLRPLTEYNCRMLYAKCCCNLQPSNAVHAQKLALLPSQMPQGAAQHGQQEAVQHVSLDPGQSSLGHVLGAKPAGEPLLAWLMHQPHCEQPWRRVTASLCPKSHCPIQPHSYTTALQHQPPANSKVTQQGGQRM